MHDLVLFSTNPPQKKTPPSPFCDYFLMRNKWIIFTGLTKTMLLLIRIRCAPLSNFQTEILIILILCTNHCNFPGLLPQAEPGNSDRQFCLSEFPPSCINFVRIPKQVIYFYHVRIPCVWVCMSVCIQTLSVRVLWYIPRVVSMSFELLGVGELENRIDWYITLRCTWLIPGLPTPELIKYLYQIYPLCQQEHALWPNLPATSSASWQLNYTVVLVIW